LPTASALRAPPPPPDGKGRKASKEVRQQQLIEATIDSLAARGYAGTTMADVADGAGLSRGIVNFHFDSKETLLVETLRHLADEYGQHWRQAVAKAAPNAPARLWALVAADFDKQVCNRRKLAAWCAFWGEAKSRPTYQELCGARDDEYQDVILGLCRTIVADGGYALDPATAALGINAILEGLWLRLMLDWQRTTRERAHAAAIQHLVALFPKHFTTAGPSG
jgi:TetR/AcrR family transcriptional repressor of bet genes